MIEFETDTQARNTKIPPIYSRSTVLLIHRGYLPSQNHGNDCDIAIAKLSNHDDLQI